MSVTLAKASGSFPVAEVTGSVSLVAVARWITDPKVAVSVTVPEAAGSVPTAAAAPMLSVGTLRAPEELERSCLLDAGDLVLAFEASSSQMLLNSSFQSDKFR